ncbi:MAG: tetratricopeptide repeat protein [Candidatus Omnitrophica bacterium]|nr:tetratricopeptide repeat protein [Candidatus Omnitrophota bacterium]
MISLPAVPKLWAEDNAVSVSTNAAAPSAAEEVADLSVPSSPVPPVVRTPSSEFLKKAWEFSGKNDLASLLKLVDGCLALYDEEAWKQQASLTDFPMRGRENEVSVLNDVGTILFIKAEALMNNGKTEEAVAEFQKIIKEYSFAQAWDPSRGAFWSVKDKSQASIDVMLGNVVEEDPVSDSLKTIPPVLNPGKEKVIDYRKFGQFSGVGTTDYKFTVSKPKDLTAAVGYGIYPSNTSIILKSPEYLKVKKEGRLEGSHWDFLRSTDLEAAYFKWINAPEPAGIRLFYQGLIFERAKMYHEALKAFHSLVVYFPNTVAWTYWQTPWYPAQAAVSKIQHIIRTHPELNLTSQWMKIEVANGFDNDVSNDSVTTWPGIIKEKGAADRFKDKMSFVNKSKALGKVKRTLGSGRVQLMQYENDHWKMFVDDKPFVIKGVTYAPTKIGQSPDKGTLVSWMKEDSNGNGLLDGPYEAWVDENKNDTQDANEPTVGDFAIMKDMGVNTLREYYQPFKPVKEVLRKMYREYGFMVIMGNFIGKYTHGSGASWFEGTNYSNPVHQENMMKSVREMVMDLKDEPYILMWLLGNENNYGVANNADKDPVAYYKFVNDVAKMIHEIDPDHPVAICSGDTLFLDLFAKNAPEVDVFGANVYRGDYGFGSFWEQVSGATGKPAFITEYGSPAYTTHLSLDDGEIEQANYHRGNWLDIESNLGGHPEGIGNALGGVAFEWLDEWWKNYEPYRHDKKSEAIGPFAGGYYFEEWFGLNAQGKGKHSPFLRQPRKVFGVYKEMWKSKP